jgi:hypothetical protein
MAHGAEEGIPPEAQAKSSPVALELPICADASPESPSVSPTAQLSGALDALLLAMLLEATSEAAAPPPKEALNGIIMACGERCLDEMCDVVNWMVHRLTHDSLFVKHKTLFTLKVMFSLPLLVEAFKSAPAALMEIEALSSLQAPDDMQNDKPVLVVRDAANVVITMLEEQLNVKE